MSARPAVLVIAGSDSSGGAGVVRDVQVLTDFGVDALCAVTAVTAQSNSGVFAVHHIPPAVIRAQIRAAFATRAIAGVKIGMLGNRGTIDAVVDSLPRSTTIPIVLDPVLVSSSGGELLDAEGRRAMCQVLFPRASLVTPNMPEAAMLLEEGAAANETAAVEQARRLLDLGPQGVLIKGGHAEGTEAVDLLVTKSGAIERITDARIDATCRGTGCALASAITSGLASGLPLSAACRGAKSYVYQMLTRADST
jgi:hydroxymethylpyrimidine/phosphomethylpyrimidine kinase